MPPTQIRPVHPDDLAELVRLCEEHARFERASIDTAGMPERLAAALFAPLPRLWGWVAVDGSGCAGYATASAEYSTWRAAQFLHMDCLFVRDGRRNEGIGAALFAAVRRHALDGGYADIEWQTPAWNVAAARFYRRSGATDAGKLRFCLGLRSSIQATAAQGGTENNSQG